MSIFHHKTRDRIWLPLEDKEGPLFPEIEGFMARVPRAALAISLTPGQKGEPRTYSFSYARNLVRRARRKIGLPEHLTLEACRHGAMTELGDAELTEQHVMSLSGHRTPNAARLYVHRTEQQRLVAARRRRAFVDALDEEQSEAESRNESKIVAESK